MCMLLEMCLCVVFFFKQKTAYEMRISDWSSDVCSSDLFSLTYIENAQMLPGVRKLTDAEHEAIKLLMEVAEEQCFEMRFAPGDIQLLNNHVVYHGRTAFKDDATTGQDRMLMRLWRSVPNSRALPEAHAVLWGRIGRTPGGERV